MAKFQIFPTSEVHLFTELSTGPLFDSAPIDFGRFFEFQLLNENGKEIDADVRI